MPIRPRTIDLALDYVEKHFGVRKLFPIKPGAKFPPLIKDNLAKASSDPEQLRAWENQWPGCSWGIVLRGSNLLIVDIDTNPKKGKQGQQTYDELDLVYGWPETETVETPSGGFHKYYIGLPDLPIPMALGENGLGKDIDVPNYVLMPGCTFDDGTSYKLINDIDAALAPQWMYDTINMAKTKSRISDAGDIVVELDKPANVETAIDFLKTDAEPSIQGSGGDFALLKTAYYLKDLGISQELGAQLLNEYFNPRCEPPWDMDDLAKKMAGAYSYANLSKVGGKTGEADFADDAPEPIKPMGDPKKIKKEKAERAKAKEVEAARPDDPSRAKTKAEIIDRWVWVASMKRFINKADPKGNYERDIWDTKQFDSMFNCILAPKRGSGSDLLFRVKKGGLERYLRPGFKPGQPQSLDAGQTFNFYRTPDVTPEEGDVSWWNEHLEYLFPDQESRDHVLNWSAWLIQNLAKKPKHALIVQGPVQGTGKSFIAKVLTRILHQANVSVVPQSGLSGRFNSWALQCKLIVIEELRAVDRATVKETLHDIITEDMISIEKKGVDMQKIENCFGIFAMSNDDAAIMIDNTDRRYLIVRTDAEKRSRQYYDALYARLDDPRAMAAVMYALMNRNVGEYSGQQAAPMTEAKAKMQDAGRSDIEHHLADSMDIWPLNSRIINIDDVVSALPKRLESKGLRLISTIKAFLIREGALELGQCSTPSGKRPRLYAKGPQAAFIARQARTFAGKTYEDDLAKAKKNLPPDALDASEEFGDTE